jgi:arginine repressor
MQKINSETSLREAIIQLERKRAFEGALLKEEFRITLEGLKPVNLIKSTLKEVVGSGELKDNVVNASVGAGAGFLAKIIIGSVTKSPFKRILGTVAMFGIKNVIARNPETVKSLGKAFFKMIRNKSGGRVIQNM